MHTKHTNTCRNVFCLSGVSTVCGLGISGECSVYLVKNLAD